MTAKWNFERKRRSQKSRDPMQASFFTNSSIDDDTHALVREAIQNSLDAKSSGSPQSPVRARFFIGYHDAKSGVMNRYISSTAWRHFNALDNGLSAPPTASDSCRYLVYEDFNTDGLIGNEQSSEAEDGNSFYYFMRAEGQSGKEDGERGRHGIGKYVFPHISGIRMFIAATVRSSDGKCMVVGQSVLKSHHVDGQRYTPDGWWGDFENEGKEDYFQLPIVDEGVFKQLKVDFELKRTTSQNGLSLVMPYIQEEVKAEKLVEHIIGEYFWAIISGYLVVDVIEGSFEKVIDSKTIGENLNLYFRDQKLNKMESLIPLAIEARKSDSIAKVVLDLSDKPRAPSWSKNYLSEDKSNLISNELNKPNGIVRVRCPLYVQLGKSDAKEVVSHFDVYIAKDMSDSPMKPLFVREGITIPEDRVASLRGYVSVVVIEAGALASLLGDSENPAHTEWEKNASKFKGKYKWGSSTIDFVRQSAGRIIKLLSQSDEEVDNALLSDIFFIDLPENEDDVPESRKRKESKVPGPKPEPPPDVDVPKKVGISYNLSKRSGGFVLKGPKDQLQTKRKYSVKVAYDLAGSSKAKAFKNYHVNDFNFVNFNKKGFLGASNLSDLSIKENVIEFTADANDFLLDVSGFDYRRDIIVEIKTEALEYEKV